MMRLEFDKGESPPLTPEDSQASASPASHASQRSFHTQSEKGSETESPKESQNVKKEEKEKKRRVSRGGRSREGCKNCRTRRMKCDESKPSCRNCTKADLSCEYSHSVKRWVLVEYQGRQQQQPQILVPGTSTERRAFDFFHRTTAAELSGLFGSEFWNESVLRFGFENSSLRHAVVAIGSMHERFIQGQSMHAMQLRLASDPEYLFALKQYTMAVTELHTSLAAGTCPPQVALMCCLLFICFESFRGSPSTAMMHFKYGLQVIHAWKQGKLSEKMDPLDPTTRSIRGLVARLGPQLTNVDMLDVSDFGASEADLVKHTGDLFEGLAALRLDTPTPDFGSLDEARDELNDLINMEICYFYQVNPLYGDTSPEKLAGLRRLFQDTVTGFADWGVKFAMLWRSSLSTMSAADSHTALFLQMQYKFMLLLVNCLFLPNTENLSPEETDRLLHAWTPQFREVLELIENFVTSPQHTRLSQPQFYDYSNTNSLSQAQDSKPLRKHSTFYPEVGVVLPLFLLGLGARDADVRRRATALLKGERRREGTWDSETCWQVLEFIGHADKAQVREFLTTRYKLYSHFAFMGESN